MYVDVLFLIIIKKQNNRARVKRLLKSYGNSHKSIHVIIFPQKQTNTRRNEPVTSQTLVTLLNCKVASKINTPSSGMKWYDSLPSAGLYESYNTAHTVCPGLAAFLV